MHGVRTLVALTMTVSPVACGGVQPPPMARSVTDSAGVEVVTIRFRADVPPVEFDVDPVPQVEIGVVRGAQALQLSQVVGAVRLPDGRVVVGNGGTNELRIYEPDGLFSHSIGGDGEGPGEFRSIDYLGLHGQDTIVVYDRRLGRISLFHPAGALLSSHRITGAILPYVVGEIGSGTVVAWQFAGVDDERLGIYRVPMEFGVVDLPDGEFRVAGSVPSGEEARVRYKGRMARAFRPFGREADVAAGGDFFFVLSSSDDRSIRVYDSARSLARILRVELPLRPADAAAVDAWVESWMTVFSTGSPELEAWWRYGFRETPPPDYIPVFRGLEVDAHGNVCAERYPLTWGSGPRYWCFSPEGRFAGSFRLPVGVPRRGPHPHFDPQFEIGSDYVLGVWEDALDVQHVRKYRLWRH